ncbi:hypothetical protein JDN40_10105 [Rhodomicrobium vannielii ATCC 17100]|uniref:hypothetical protein n=1 Tax=Rhodomicrobium vannielii TaxID=1069 RepID=UPI001919D050|nr:hypothetical protein [Rhodomicrobium vannielii]MBJ7534456.1 hypothetical protein [Rhodomicrobium vannielii ATCC 17100]
MSELTVGELIQALTLVGQHYRGKNDQPADPVKKLLAQLQGYDNLSLSEWANAKTIKKTKKITRKINENKVIKPKSSSVDDADIQQIRKILESEASQEALQNTIKGLEKRFGAETWKAAGRIITGRYAGTGKLAREQLETYFRDAILLQERVESVNRIYG